MNLHDVVTLKEDMPTLGLLKGAKGVIVSIFDNPTQAYEVEFCDNDGRTICEVALTPEQIVPFTPY